MMTRKLTSLLLAGLLATASAASFAANDSTDATGTKSGGASTSTMPPDNTPGAPAGGNSSDGGGGTGTGTNGGASGSGSGAGGGTGSAGGGTGGAGGGTGG